MPLPTPSATTIKRIHREIADLQKEDLGAITLRPSDDSLFLWNATLPGPEGSVYEGGVFQVEIVLGHDYPFSAPKMTFKTRIYHMNISDRGGICIDILKHNWSPALSLFKVILSLSSLLTDPNPKDPLVPSIATEYVRSRSQHDRTARHWTQLYAKPPPPPKSAPVVVVPAVASRAKASTPVNAGRARAAPTRSIEAIVIEDSDEEDAPRSAALPKRKRDVDGADVDSSGTDDVLSARRNRRRVNGGPEGSSARDVIVIDD
ncbi:hypothetical protein EIP91_000779 [Steccherinum ochraceum]|uniref:E2 ubiquitin-conjugating enzyme n=1 Tax=Steccherinum ochraceum TaxID=92696 RepID=A0A4R0RFA9_9APHY|nr:hypothetical protein EIP91_000779 [Steccherinum ochraceum]